VLLGMLAGLGEHEHSMWRRSTPLLLARIVLVTKISCWAYKSFADVNCGWCACNRAPCSRLAVLPHVTVINFGRLVRLASRNLRCLDTSCCCCCRCC
jgi:hypothetical protein